MTYYVRTLCGGLFVGVLLLGGGACPAWAAEGAAVHHGPPGGDQARLVSPVSWCGDYKLGQMNEAERLTGQNLARLRAAEAELAPGFEAQTVQTGLYLLADYQQELEKRHPDGALAASYLAMASAVPITQARYRQVNALLCVSAAPVLARTIRAQAETWRRQEDRASTRKDAGS